MISKTKVHTAAFHCHIKTNFALSWEGGEVRWEAELGRVGWGETVVGLYFMIEESISIKKREIIAQTSEYLNAHPGLNLFLHQKPGWNVLHEAYA